MATSQFEDAAATDLARRENLLRERTELIGKPPAYRRREARLSALNDLGRDDSGHRLLEERLGPSPRDLASR